MAGLKCPHCTVTFAPSWFEDDSHRDVEAHWGLRYTTCSSCEKLIAQWVRRPINGTAADRRVVMMIRPRGASRPLDVAVPESYRGEFAEAVETLTVSAKASAALSRRLLQRTIHEQAGIKDRNLDREIQAVIDSGKLPDDLAEDLDAVRTTGNFAAHPIKSQSTGEIMDVEPGEAEWLLDVLEELFEQYFVKPAARKAKRDAMNAKLTDAGKPTLKGT